jgi:hypothetical protein
LAFQSRQLIPNAKMRACAEGEMGIVTAVEI